MAVANTTTLDEIIAKSGDEMLLFSDSISNMFIRLYCDEYSIIEFEKEVYSNSTLETELKNDYLDLISFDFKSKDAKYRLKKLIKNIYRNHQKYIEVEIVYWLVIRMTNDEYGLINGCERLARLARNDEFDYMFIPKEYVGLESLMEDLGFYYNPNDQNDICEKTRLIEEYKIQIKELNTEFLRKLIRRGQ
ncbi:hypothetical protein [Cohnella herbarum]|uniref:Uncharacterized protein n=1 Tax=Cohnella herbarum TaxID=2728023 RepID=A0A7Z2VGH7_9BACL|nr:hypothetical protein [Cohnella herbarum]QJD82788.1 hypothetical protein HH215_06060 [Cohnella herbarum]